MRSSNGRNIPRSGKGKNGWLPKNYIDIVIEQHQKVLEQTDDAILVHRQQGAIAVLRKLKYLRDEVNGTKRTNGTI